MIKKFKNKFFEENLSLDMKLFYVTLMTALLTCMIGIIISYFSHVPTVAILLIGVVLLFLVLLGIIIQRVEKFTLGCYIAIILISLIVYPTLFITGGGIESGMPAYWVLLIVMTFFVSTDRKPLLFIIFLQITILVLMVAVEFYYPSIIIKLANKRDVCLDIIISVIVSALAIGTVVEFQRAKYIRENKKAEEAVLLAKEANKAKSLFLANMSHEIRTPMNAILGMLELILRADIGEDVREKAHNIQNASASLLSIINDILDFSKIESGKMVITLERYQFSSVINDVINMISIRLLGKDVELFVNVDPKIPSELMGDQVRIRQVLINLLNNAVKFTPAGSITINIGCRFRQDSILLFINVIDTGIGIKDENIDKIFRSFERVGEYENRNIEGTGLGLAICKQLLELMGGSIAVQSEFGKGSTFSVLLPQKVVNKASMVFVNNEIERKILVLEKTRKHADILKNTFKQIGLDVLVVQSLDQFKCSLINEEYTNIFISKGMYEKEEAFIRKNSGDAKVCVLIDYNAPILTYENVLVVRRPICCMTIAAVLNEDNSKLNYSSVHSCQKFTAVGAEVLVIDDNLINLEVIRGLLNYYKINVTIAISGKEALDLLKNPKYDLILLDYMMPELDGIETLRLLRKRNGDYYKNVPVVALTANAVSGAREMFINEGFQDYIAKPIDVSKLEMILTSYLPKEILRISRSNVLENDMQEPKLPEVEGINTHIGIKNCNGDIENYLRILDIVVIEGKEKCNILKKYYKEQNYERYIVEVHGIKGAMMSIGAITLGEIAKSHEFAGKEENYDFIDENIEVFINKYEELIHNIEQFLDDKEAEDENGTGVLIDQGRLREELGKVEELLENYDSSTAEEKVNELLQYELENATRIFMKELRKQIEELEYEEALELLHNWRKICTSY
jgi:two-component system sensor histidine kinase/response regulator